MKEPLVLKTLIFQTADENHAKSEVRFPTFMKIEAKFNFSDYCFCGFLNYISLVKQRK
jgi:hypothetical protein